MQTDADGTPLDDARFGDVIHRLVTCHTDQGVLSVYLDIDPSTAGREGYEAALMDLWKPLHDRPSDEWTRGRLEYEVASVTEAVRGWQQPPGRAVAMFFGTPCAMRIVLPLHFPIRSVARFETRPVLGPLIAALQEHGRYGVVMFDSERARIITVSLGAVEDEVALQDDVPGRTAAGGWGQANYARHREQHVDEHARRTVEQLEAIVRSRPVHWLVLAGPDEALAALRRVLPPSLARTVVSSVPVEMFAPTAAVVQRVSPEEAAAHEREDRRVVEELISAAEDGGRAALGWDDTLQALGAGRVHKLVLPAELTRPGVQCPAGHYLATSTLKFCPLCREPLSRTDDIAEAAVHAALLSDARIYFVRPPAATLLADRGPGAFLRY